MSIHTIMTQDASGQELVDFAKQTAQKLVSENLTRSQIRTIFTEVRQIEAMWDIRKVDAMRRLNMLKPKLAYQTARSAPVKHLQEVLSEAITEVEKSNDKNVTFKRFMDLFEAILAYHRALGGRN